MEAFNTRPKAGITAAISAGVIGHSPGDVARFLFGQPGLDKVKIGEYVGEMEEFPYAALPYRQKRSLTCFSVRKFSLLLWRASTLRISIWTSHCGAC